MSQASCSLKLLNIFTALGLRFMLILSHTEDFEKSIFISKDSMDGELRFKKLMQRVKYEWEHFEA